MPIVLGVDLGTSKVTALALDAAGGDVLACSTVPNPPETTTAAGKRQGFCEWDAAAIARTACDCLRSAAGVLGPRCRELAGLGITGQQHGVLLVGAALAPLTPFINWQDRRGEQLIPGAGKTYVTRAVELAGQDAPRRAGCTLAAGYMGVTLFWMKETSARPPRGKACFLMDYFGTLLTGRPPVTDPSCAASSGLFDVAAGDWDRASLAALGLPRDLFPEVRPSGERLGGLIPALADMTGLPAGLPVFAGIGDNQASFLGSVAEPADTVLVNVGTGGQVAAHTARFTYDPLLETRPFPGEGYLLVSAGLCGGGSYALLEQFFGQVGARLFGVPGGEALYASMNRLAGEVPRGADGLRCAPVFTGTRARPELRASWTGLSPENFTPGHLARALLEGMAEVFHAGSGQIARHTGASPHRLVGAGNGLRGNPVLARAVSDAFALPLRVPCHRDEAAYGAALVAAVGSGACRDWAAAGRLIRLAEPGVPE